MVIAVAAAPSFAPPAAFIAPATFANTAIPPTSTALNATVGFIAIFCCLQHRMPFPQSATETSRQQIQSFAAPVCDNKRFVCCIS
ncbi:unnamed protein product [Linum trigynum]|uniref:Secreted peptide n=1 Tax=Linum trigynum TaxID=586398 RepID=A0AAV2FMX3_9ROSI